MKKFTDTKGREFEVSLTIGRAKRVLDFTDVDLMNPEAYAKLLADDIKFAEVIAVLLESQFAKHGIDTGNMLADDWDGDTHYNAVAAFRDEYQLFFKALRQQGKAEAVRKTAEMYDGLMAEMEKAIAKVEVSKAVEEAVSGGGTPSGRPPDEQGLTPQV